MQRDYQLDLIAITLIATSFGFIIVDNQKAWVISLLLGCAFSLFATIKGHKRIQKTRWRVP